MRLRWPSSKHASGRAAAMAAPRPLPAWLASPALHAVPRLPVVAPARPGPLGVPALDQLLADESVSEIMVNGPTEVWVERAGRLEPTDVRLADADELQRVINRIVVPLGRRCDEAQPMVDARLPDGSRVHAIVPPLCLNGPTLTIRKFPRAPLTARDLVLRGTASADVLEFLRACVRGRCNLVVSGGTGTGKTTLLNVLSAFIPDDERIVTIESAAELRLQQRHVVTLEGRPADVEGRGAVTVRDLVVNALRMRPDRIVIGECRAGEALDMLQAMNTGHEGSLTTLHANGPRDALHRLETMVLMAGLELPVPAIRRQIAAAVHVIVQLERLVDGRRRIARVCEVAGMEGEVICLNDLFVVRGDAAGADGVLVPTGLRPMVFERLARRGVALPLHLLGL